MNREIQRQKWDSRAEEFNGFCLEKLNEKPRKNAGQLMIDMGWINNRTEVLDLGCGPGKYTMIMAQYAKKVTGIDISPKMLEHAKNNVRELGLTNCDFEAFAWQEMDVKEKGWENAFDLVFASMTPGIDSEEDLEKLLMVSRRYGFVSGFTKRNNVILNKDIAALVKNNRVYENFKSKPQMVTEKLWEKRIFFNALTVPMTWQDDYDVEGFKNWLKFFEYEILDEEKLNSIFEENPQMTITVKTICVEMWIYWDKELSR